MKLSFNRTEQKPALQKVDTKPTGGRANLQQAGSSSSPQAAAGSLATDGKNRGKMPDVHQQSSASDGSQPARQQKKSFSLKGMLGLKKSSASSTSSSSAQATASGRPRGTTLSELLARDEVDSDAETPPQSETASRPGTAAQSGAARPRGTTLSELMARGEGKGASETSASTGQPVLTRSGGGRRDNLGQVAESPAVKGDDKQTSASTGQPGLTRSGGGRRDNLGQVAESPAANGDNKHTSASTEQPRLTRSGAIRRDNLEQMAGRPTVTSEEQPPTSEHRQQLQNFSQMRQNMLSRLTETSGSHTGPRIRQPQDSSASTRQEAPLSASLSKTDQHAAVDEHSTDSHHTQNQPHAGASHHHSGVHKHSGAGSHHEIEDASHTSSSSSASRPARSEITEEDDDSEFEQLNQQRLAREKESLNTPLGLPKLNIPKFKPTLAPIIESGLEGTSMKQPALDSGRTLSSGLATGSLGISLENGKLKLAETNSPSVNTLLSQTLGKANQHYVAHTASSDNRQHVLLDKEGRLFDIKSDETGYCVMHNTSSADLKAKLAQAGDKPVSLENHDGKIRVSIGSGANNQMTLSGAGKAHRSMLSGVWQHPASAGKLAGSSVFLHDDKIHILNTRLGTWQTSEKDSHSQLSRQADGKLYALRDSRTLCNLSDNQASEKLVDKIKSFAVSERGQVAMLTDTESPHHMCLLPSLNASPEERVQFSLHLADTMQMLKRGEPHLETQSVAMSNGRLFAADSEGKLYSGALSHIKDGELPMKSVSQKVLKQHFGHDHRIAGFFTDDHGKLNAIVKDNFRQQHACPLGDDHQFHPGWNMTDALVIDSKLGLDHINPEPHNILDMGREGSLTLHEGKVHYFDQLTKGWTAAESDCKQLKKGLDGAAYILKDGEVKRLDINQSTSSISQGKNNVFSMPHVRNKPEPGSALLGLDKADKAQAMAVIGVNKYLALSDKGEISLFHIKPGTQRLERIPQKFGLDGITGSLKDIHVDQQQNLYAVNHNGDIFHQPREQWQSEESKQGENIGNNWQKLPAVSGDSELKQLHMDDQHQPVATLEDSSQHVLKAGQWHPYTPAERGPLEVGTRDSEHVFNRLSQGLKGQIIPGAGITAVATAQAAGNTGLENRRVSSKFADRIRAYIFNPTAATPRPIKNAAYNVQHNWQGREGLKSVYEMQGALIKQLESHNVRNKGAQVDLHSKLEALDLGDEGASLLKEMKHFREELEHSATHSATILGKHQGALKSNGDINKEFKPSATKGAIQSLNVNRSGRDLSKALEKAVSLALPSTDSKLQKLLSHMVSAGVNMSHQKGDVPLGRQRDPNDQTALTKSRLILDTVTMGELHQLADKAALISGHKPDASQVKQLREQFEALRQQQYGNNPVKQYTDMGFTNNGALEANYDAVKSFINAFKKEHHGVNLTTRTVLETKGKEELEKKLKDALLSLDNGESISFSREYSGSLSTVFVPSLNKIPVPIVPGAGLTVDRAYNLSFGRTSGGLNVSFGRDGGMSGTVSLYTGYDLMPSMTGKALMAQNASDWLDKKHKISPDFRVGGSLSSNLAGTMQNSLNFKLTEDEVPDFIHGLTHGTLTPIELMQKGIEHKMKQGTRLVFKVDTSAAFDLRAGINITKDGSKPDTVTARVSTGVNASANLMSARRDRSKEASELVSTATASNNRATFLNTASVGANMTASVGVARSTSTAGKATGTFPAFINPNVSASLAMDNRTTQRISIEMKHADPVTTQDISELTSTLGKHFKDADSTRLLADLKKEENPNPAEQLVKLHSHFNKSTVLGDDRYEAVRNLQLLTFRQQAAETNTMQLGTARHSTSYNNLSRIDKNSFVGLLQKHFNASLPPSSATRLSGLMESDPMLKGLIKQLQSIPFSSASVSMELKDDLRDRTEKAILEGKVGREELGVLFQDPHNLRIRSISVSQTVTKSEGFNMPALLLGGNNSAGMSMERNMGSINFKYGQDQNIPRRFTLEGEIAKANPEVAAALTELKKEGFEMKS